MDLCLSVAIIYINREYNSISIRYYEISSMKQSYVDLFIIGGGINGAGIAADAAGRGLSVTLCEQSDLASATSSNSTKLIHGGLRYLEHYELRLVRESLKEREVLLNKAPHIIRPLQFIMPHVPTLRPRWLIRLGLFLYDHLGKRQRLAASHGLSLKTGLFGDPLRPSITKGFSYYDCWVDDARLVIINAIAARQLGASILTRTQFVSAKRMNDYWQISTKNLLTGQTQAHQAKAIINAGGPWVDSIISNQLNMASKYRIRLVKGSHIIVPALHPGNHAYILQNPDKRVIFALPYENKFTLIGTTEVSHEGDPANATISNEEINYLCDSINHYFQAKISPKDIISSYSGVRALWDDQSDISSEVTRDYALELSDEEGKLPLLSLYGGKLTTYRCLAEKTLQDLSPYFPKLGPQWTESQPLPGGDIACTDAKAYAKKLQQNYPWLSNAIASRYARSYGSLCHKFLQAANSFADLGQHFGAGLTEAEVKYLIEEEWAVTIEDILWRRTKQGLHLTEDEQLKLKLWLTKNLNLSKPPSLSP